MEKKKLPILPNDIIIDNVKEQFPKLSREEISLIKDIIDGTRKEATYNQEYIVEIEGFYVTDVVLQKERKTNLGAIQEEHYKTNIRKTGTQKLFDSVINEYISEVRLTQDYRNKGLVKINSDVGKVKRKENSIFECVVYFLRQASNYSYKNFEVIVEFKDNEEKEAFLGESIEYENNKKAIYENDFTTLKAKLSEIEKELKSVDNKKEFTTLVSELKIKKENIISELKDLDVIGYREWMRFKDEILASIK